MWCRALLTITCLACTFQRTNGQSHDTKDLLCVLILSGLQKEDLDVALLRKLQRHNVNVDDLDNVDVRNECKLENANNSDNETKNDVPEPMRRDFDANQTKRDKVENQTMEVNATKEEENITKLLQLISKITPAVKPISSITPEVNRHNINKENTTTTTTTTTKAVTPEEPHPNSITYINRVLQQFIAQIAPTTTTTPTTTTVDFKSILYEIKEMLANKPVNNIKDSTENINNQQEYNYDDDNLKIKVYTKAINKIMNKNKDVTIMRRNKEYAKNLNKSHEVLKVRPTKVETKSQSTSKPVVQHDIKTIPKDIIKDIADSVRALVLKDLKKEIRSTTTTSTTNIIETTTIKQDNIEKLIQLFQHLRNNITPVVEQKQHEIKSSINVTPTLTTAPNISYSNPVISHIIHNIQAPALTYLDTELQSLPNYQRHSINRIDQLNIFNPKHEMHPITIQTSIGQIPPLKIPMMAPQIKMIYQNIVVTTENYFQHFKNLHKHKSTHPNIDYTYKNDNQKLSSKPQLEYSIKIVESPKPHDYLNLKPFDHSSHYNQVERMRTQSHYLGSDYNQKQEYHHARARNRNFERFHEKLEKPDDGLQYSKEQNIEKMKVSSRHLRPLSNNKPKFDDTHFKNFLKTQQKVNDMLERILATKTIEGPRSVEII